MFQISCSILGASGFPYVGDKYAKS